MTDYENGNRSSLSPVLPTADSAAAKQKHRKPGTGCRTHFDPSDLHPHPPRARLSCLRRRKKTKILAVRQEAMGSLEWLLGVVSERLEKKECDVANPSSAAACA